MAEYIMVEFAKAGVAYQEVVDGRVVRYVDAGGGTMFVEPPVDDDCRVADASSEVTERMREVVDAGKPEIAVDAAVAAVSAVERADDELEAVYRAAGRLVDMLGIGEQHELGAAVAAVRRVRGE